MTTRKTAQAAPDQAGTPTPSEPSDAPTPTGYEFVRVKDPISGHEVTVSAMFAEANNLPVLDKPAVDEWGRVLPAKPNVNKGAAPASEESV